MIHHGVIVLVRGALLIPLAGCQTALVPPDLVLPPYLREFQAGQPLLRRNESWHQTHPAAVLVRRGSSEAPAIHLCMFGVPGVQRGKAGAAERNAEASRQRGTLKATQTSAAARASALNQMKYVVLPVEENLGVTVRIFVHAWTSDGAIQVTRTPPSFNWTASLEDEDTMVVELVSA